MYYRENYDINVDATLFVIGIGANDLIFYNGKAKDVVKEIKKSVLFL